MVQELVAVFCASFKDRYDGVNPEMTGKELGSAKRLIKDLGLGKAKDFVSAYFKMPGVPQWKHKMSLMDVNAVKIFIERGSVSTRVGERQDELKAHNIQVMNRAIEKIRKRKEETPVDEEPIINAF